MRLGRRLSTGVAEHPSAPAPQPPAPVEAGHTAETPRPVETVPPEPVLER